MSNIGFKSVRPDFFTSHGFRWPFEGRVEAPGPILEDNAGACPKEPGDGLSVGLTARACRSGGIPLTGPLLVVKYDEADVLGRDNEKIRVRACQVSAVLDVCALLREHLWNGGADLGGADLGGADLRRAYLGDAMWDESTRWPDGYTPPERVR